MTRFTFPKHSLPVRIPRSSDSLKCMMSPFWMSLNPSLQSKVFVPLAIRSYHLPFVVRRSISHGCLVWEGWVLGSFGVVGCPIGEIRGRMIAACKMKIPTITIRVPRRLKRLAD